MFFEKKIVSLKSATKWNKKVKVKKRRKKDKSVKWQKSKNNLVASNWIFFFFLQNAIFYWNEKRTRRWIKGLKRRKWKQKKKHKKKNHLRRLDQAVESIAVVCRLIESTIEFVIELPTRFVDRFGRELANPSDSFVD